MRLLLLICAASAMPLAACATMPASPAAVVSTDPIPIASETTTTEVYDVAMLNAEKSLTLTALAYDSAAKAATAAVETGAIRGAALIALSDLNRRATAALAFGYTATTAAEKARAVVTLGGLVQQIKNLAAP